MANGLDFNLIKRYIPLNYYYQLIKKPMAPRKYNMDRRKEAVEETRRRIIDATVVLHAEQGILATSWEDIAKKADVALATVYRHFPSLEELVPACGEQVVAIVKPPTLEAVRDLLSATSSQPERVRLLVQELFEFYDRGRTFLNLTIREAHQVPALAEWMDGWDASREEMIRETLQPKGSDGSAVQMMAALTDYRTWRSIFDRNVRNEVAVEMLGSSLTHLLAQRDNSEK